MGDKGFRRYIPMTFLIGFGFFTMGLMDPLYDTFVPQFLKKYIESNAIIGFLMTLDNIFAVLLIPIISSLSDRCRTPIGRRMPFILIALPFAAILFALFPYAANISLIVLLLCLFVFNIFKQISRGPIVSLMPDLTPPEYRSEANGIINTMGGIAAIIGTLFLAKLMDFKINLSIFNFEKGTIPFPLTGVIVIFSLIVLFLFIREKTTYDDVSEKPIPMFKSLTMIFTSQNKSTLFILISLFLWFFGYNAILPFMGLYSINGLGVSPGLSSFAAGMVAIGYAIFAIPSGYIARRTGRKKIIQFLLIVISVICFIVFIFALIQKSLPMPSSFKPIFFWFMFFLFGLSWGGIMANSFPMLWQIADAKNIGLYTGLYYTFSQGAAIISPPISGLIIDISGYPGMFLLCVVCMVCAYFVMNKVQKGEITDSNNVVV